MRVRLAFASILIASALLLLGYGAISKLGLLLVVPSTPIPQVTLVPQPSPTLIAAYNADHWREVAYVCLQAQPQCIVLLAIDIEMVRQMTTTGFADYIAHRMVEQADRFEERSQEVGTQQSLYCVIAGRYLRDGRYDARQGWCLEASEIAKIAYERPSTWVTLEALIEDRFAISTGALPQGSATAFPGQQYELALKLLQEAIDIHYGSEENVGA